MELPFASKKIANMLGISEKMMEPEKPVCKRSEEMKKRWANPEWRKFNSLKISQAHLKRHEKMRANKEKDKIKKCGYGHIIGTEGRCEYRHRERVKYYKRKKNKLRIECSSYTEGQSERIKEFKKRADKLEISEKRLLEILIDEFLARKEDVRLGFIS